MAVNIAEIQKLRKMTGAGLADCKKALADADGDINKAIEIIREKGQAIAAKRSDRDASNGCVLVKYDNGFAAIIALKCETDFVANNADHIKLTQAILDAAVAKKAKTLDEVKALILADGHSVEDAVIARSGITGEKMELDGYLTLEGENIYTYNHQNTNLLCTLVQTNKPAPVEGHAITMQVAAMNPVALDEASVPQSIKDEELRVAIEKTREEQAAKGKTPSDEMLQKIAQGRMGKFFKESCLLNQEFIQDSKLSVTEYLHAADKELTVVAFKRFTLRAE
ncbi:MAG: translation elongation factor Ts [Hoylesella marshii]|uniref:Elongation factor Ts n=1 Tax=Hoylesella marshii DSM 16973 = JCM 13450 TaxID=862515 RepID=E0NTS3_9BACT|nr:translation elongation factor Ts [Hoylesella marshii]EFM01456.1 translation elongation factor Ts [Hoylesella marshii DSM 16973 = JCM 13450]